MQHEQSGRRSVPAGISLWMIGGGVVGLIEAVVAYDPKLSFHPISDWITRLVLVPSLYALGAAVIWLVLGVDGLVKDLAQTAAGFASALRRPQSGRIRMYVLAAATAAAIGVIVVLWFGGSAAQAGEWVPR